MPVLVQEMGDTLVNACIGNMFSAVGDKVCLIPEACHNGNPFGVPGQEDIRRHISFFDLQMILQRHYFSSFKLIKADCESPPFLKM